MSAPAAGDTFTAERTFTVAMVEAFTAVSGDAGGHHVVPDDQGRLLCHGLLLASLATEIGGRLDYLARVLDFEFLRPVRTGDTVSITMRVDESTAEPGRTRLRFSGEATNQLGKVVMTCRSPGVVLDRG